MPRGPTEGRDGGRLAGANTRAATPERLLLGLVGRLSEIGELIGKARAIPAVALEPEPLQVPIPREPQLRGELGLVQQPDLVRGRPRNRLGRLDLEPAVAP